MIHFIEISRLQRNFTNFYNTNDQQQIDKKQTNKQTNINTKSHATNEIDVQRQQCGRTLQSGNVSNQ